MGGIVRATAVGDVAPGPGGRSEARVAVETADVPPPKELRGAGVPRAGIGGPE
ncbi:hypothetical protein GCM10009639_48970 [Kitasatospora putterlickiae]|uniref:Uncharacterized protein n=1 Tax=Kitasatospora putterlickiae TaxID=221725 RepID=A0ABP4J1S8_9ACTN